MREKIAVILRARINSDATNIEELNSFAVEPKRRFSSHNLKIGFCCSAALPIQEGLAK